MIAQSAARVLSPASSAGSSCPRRSTAGTNRAIKDAGTYSGAGASLQGLIAATSKKGDGWAKPLSGAVAYLIKNGQYATILKAYGDQQDSVPSSSVNPPGLPLSNA